MPFTVVAVSVLFHVRDMDDSQTLYNNYIKFKECLAIRSFPSYTESDLIEIYDVAGDNFDYYVQTEVLMLAARIFPESEEFMQRRGFLYNKMFPSVLHDFLNDNSNYEGFCWDILKLRDCSMAESELELFLDKMVERYDDLSDEDIIRLSELVREIHCESWMIRNYKALLEKAEYADTVLYETASLAHDNGDDEVALKLLDELTSIDAFRSENWILMAECYQSLENPEEGLKALEYARAISPDNIEIDFIESVLLIDMQKDMERAIELLLNYLKVYPSSSAAIHNVSLAYQLLDRTDEAAAFLRMKFSENPSDSLIVQDLITMAPEDIREILDAHRSASGDITSVDQFVNDTVQSLYLAGHYESVAGIVEQLSGSLPDMAVANYYLWSLAFLNDYAKLCYCYDVAEKKHASFFIDDPESMLLFCFALINTGRFDDATKAANKTIRRFDYEIRNNLNYRINIYGCENALNDIIRLAELRDMDAVERFDPLKIKRKD